jgi:transcriptional regulator with XRE-family HTH domain
MPTGKKPSKARPGKADALSEHLSKRLKQLRSEKGWSLDQLASACGVSRSMLSQIERGTANPTLTVTIRIAESFGMGLAEFVESPEASRSIDVVRANDPTHHYRSDKDCRIRTLSPLHMGKDVEFYEISLSPGGTLWSSPHFAGAREFLTVSKGRVHVESGADSQTLARGDSANYPADVPHQISNAGRSEAMVFLVVIYH